MEMVPSRLGDIVIPPTREVVTLPRIKTRSGEPVKVLCMKVKEEHILSVLGVPGSGEEPEGLTKQEKSDRNIAFVRRIAPDVLHLGTALLREDGTEAVPAVYFDDEHRLDGAIPGEVLGVEELWSLIECVLTLSGHGGADTPGFPAR